MEEKNGRKKNEKENINDKLFQWTDNLWYCDAVETPKQIEFTQSKIAFAFQMFSLLMLSQRIFFIGHLKNHH